MDIAKDAATAVITGAHIPAWPDLIRLFPLSSLVVLLVGLGYVIGRRSLREFIDYLLKQLDRK